MHCPDGMSGTQYVALVAALSSLLSENLNATETLILSDLLNNVSNQLLIIAAFKEAEEDRQRKNGQQNTLANNLLDASIINSLT
ncbi:MAG: hypothetical protein ABF449_02670 [Ethanoligenens sp.]|uniref:hypothetical protein n=1 Tax=Ethanoligenens sp. TaxID=2099655 RepID=UPI0039ED436B